MARKLRVQNRIKAGKGLARGAIPGRYVGAFTPYQAGQLPPSGSYDPALDAELGQAQRSNQYLLGNIGGIQGAGTYDTGDLDLAQRRADEDLASTLEGIKTTRERATAGIQRNYDILAGRQQAAFRAQGLKGGGVAQALARRQANQAYEQKPINEDYGVGNDYGRQGRAAQLAYTRGGEDRVTQASRAVTELGAYEQAMKNSAWAQAQQNNPFLTAPSKPKNQFTQGNQTYQLYRIKGGKNKGELWKQLPSGRLVPRSDMTSLM